MRKTKHKMRDMKKFFYNMGMRKSYIQIAKELDLDNRTLFNWRKDPRKQRVLELIEKGFLYEQLELSTKRFKERQNECANA